MQYTIRNIPSSVDAALRRRAREQGKSLNEVVTEALIQGTTVIETIARSIAQSPTRMLEIRTSGAAVLGFQRVELTAKSRVPGSA